MRKLPNPPKFAHAAEDCGTFCKQYTGAEDNAIHKGKVVQLENEKRWANKFCIIYIAKRTLSNNKDWFYIFTFWSVHNLLFFFCLCPISKSFSCPYLGSLSHVKSWDLSNNCIIYLPTNMYILCLLIFFAICFFSFFLCKLIKMNVLFFQTQCIVRESLRKKKKKTSSWIGPFLKDKAEKISTYIIQNFMYLMHI